jgi:hypothetical protein
MTLASKVFVSIVLCTFLVSACVPSPEAIQNANTTTAITTLWTSTPMPALTTIEETSKVVSSYLHVSDTNRRQISVGGIVEIELVSSPVIYRVARRSDGSVESTSKSRWESHNVSEMQVCVSVDTPCHLSSNWIPFELLPDAGIFGEASIQKFSFQVDWVGPRTIWLVTQFRDNNKNPVFSVSNPYEDPQVISQTSLVITGIWDEATPIGVQPPTVQTAIAATKAAFPLVGSVEIEEGRCCVGGTAGDTIEVQVNFSAISPLGKVEEMRVRTDGRCFTEYDIVDTGWEPLVPSKTYPVHVAINWIGFYVSVQYRDDRGNLSPVYCDDIGVEGHPPMPTITPTP